MTESIIQPVEEWCRHGRGRTTGNGTRT